MKYKGYKSIMAVGVALSLLAGVSWAEAAKVITLLGCPTTQKKLLGMFSKDKRRVQFKDEIKKASGGGNAVMAEITSTQGTECILEIVQEEGLSYFVSMEMVEASSRT